VGKAGLCPSCLLGLALGADEIPDLDDEGPAPVYRVLTMLAAEGDRTVYLAEQDRVRRLVTLDVARVADVGGDDEESGPRNRVRALIRWANTGVPRTIDGRRTPSGDFCVVAHHVAGPTLDRYCEARGLAGPERARLFLRVCDTVEDGHRHGICHGRLRPDLVIACASGDDVMPVVLGYSVLAGPAPSVADDLAGLERVARAMGWNGAAVPAWDSMDRLRAAVSIDWPAGSARQMSEATRG
jgi:hypothetical protein